ncbi:hypothetical protein [Clostridium gasigenes]|uniref:hypothetical protein n=1 Tax=Clostridium gasigenes TaxID=94869 RepID=UPI001C0C12F9|nr:hypothetical protein [Clostridium gasigenes]MBU3105512.1 hypothetical protein [Clostridium gasigenes]
MKSILVGNGINIQFGGKAYTNEFIMKRVKYKAKLDCYDSLFDGTLNNEEIVCVLNSFVEITNDILDKKYDDCVGDDEGLLNVLNDFKSRYKKINASHELMLEDWFFVLHMFFLKNKDISSNLRASKQGFEMLILSGIYNETKLQEIYIKMSAKVKKFFKSFDYIFTLNYDSNLEKLTGKNVYHLHGDFSVLLNSENPENVLGFIRKKKNSRVLIEGMEHCFCNALLDYSGYEKLRVANANHNLLVESEKFKWLYDNDEKFKTDLLSLTDENYEIFMTKINNPSLKIATEYYFHELDNIEDELHIIGMSPNNDGHIFECINKNRKIKKVYFYYYSDSERKLIEEMLPKNIYIAKNVNELWQSLNCTKKKYNTNHKLPEEIDGFIEVFNSLSNDTVSKDDILYEVRNIPDFEAIRLCKLVKEELKKRNLENKSIDKDELIKGFASVSSIALTEGILPSALYMLYVIYSNKISDI